MHPDSLDWHMDKNSICLLSLLRSCVFYHAARILSVIAMFFVHLLGEGEGRAEMGEGRGRGRELGKESGVGRRRGWKMGMHEKIAPKCKRFGIWGCHRPVSYIFGKLFSGTSFQSQISMPLS